MANGKTYGLSFPFVDSFDGKYLDLTDYAAEEIRSNLIHLLLTRKGSRYYLPDFGTRLYEYIFEPLDGPTFRNIESEIRDSWKDDIDIYKNKLPNSLRFSKDGKNTILFAHTTFAHQPFTVDAQCDTYQTIEMIKIKQTMDGLFDTLDCTMLVIDNFITALKKIGAYDNTAIFFIGDHGLNEPIEGALPYRKDYFFENSDYKPHNQYSSLSRYNPVLLFKDIKANNDQLVMKNDFISLIDIAPTVCRIIGCVKNDWQGVDLKEPHDIKRNHQFWIYTGYGSRKDDFWDFSKNWNLVTLPIGEAQSLNPLRDARNHALLGKLSCDTPIAFNQQKSYSPLYHGSFHSVQEWGRWGNSKDLTRIYLTVIKDETCTPEAVKFNLLVADKVKENPEQKVEIYINNQYIQDIKLNSAEMSQPITLDLPTLQSDAINMYFKIVNPADEGKPLLGFVDMQLVSATK